MSSCCCLHCRDSLTKQAMWKFNELGTSSQADSALGSIKAKFDLISGPTCPSSTYVQFTSTDNVLSGLEFELLGSGYRLSMVKRQFSSGNVCVFCFRSLKVLILCFCAGRYYCEPKVAMWCITTTAHHHNHLPSCNQWSIFCASCLDLFVWISTKASSSFTSDIFTCLNCCFLKVYLHAFYLIYYLPGFITFITEPIF